MNRLTKKAPTLPPSSSTSTTEETIRQPRSTPPFFQPKSRKWFKRLPWLILGMGITTLTVLALQPQPIPVDVGTVKRGKMTVTVQAEGKTRVKHQFIVTAPVTGRLARLNKDVGDTVQAGELLTTIDPLPLTTQVQAAQAKLSELKAQLAGVDTQRPKLASLSIAQGNIRSAEAAKREIDASMAEAQAELAQAKLDRDRFQQLETDGVVPRQQRENAELLAVQRQQRLAVLKQQQQKAIADIHSAQEALKVLEEERQDPDYLQQVYRAQIKAVEAELQNLANEVGQTQIHAPVSGKILRIEQESARFVQAGQPLFEIGNPQNLELVIDVLSTDAVKIKPGNLITIEQWGGEDSLIGQVNYIEPSAFTEVSALGVDEQRVNVIGSFLNASVPLGSEYRVESKISVWEGERVLKVPISALFRCQKDWCVFIARERKAEQRKIEIRQRNENEAAVEKGLKLDDQVILHPSENIQPGTLIQAQARE